ncbi:hypothetical protein SAMN02745163_02049 [Clostridium cavendishii DSM 21758]|uniref:Phage-related protein n=1 Tax=Clostridium cavendishii DSM 21758 TaxID=1121302 RepID=A0A1M6JYW6_9CLOT|nr:hypothetical protein [Clostridium cavendishii]SHJ51889.1 hypothetical protein SAMN02745163_02049 [Clostridium cavendishii DSM 21758]
MSDSVGKITLDLEIASDIGKQVSAISNLMGKNLKDTLNNSFKSSFDGINKSAKESLNSVDSTMKNMLSRIKDSTRKTLSSAFATMKKIKLPTPKFPEVNIAKPKVASISKTIGTRGPPTVNKEMLKSQIEGIERTLDNTNAKIEQQQAKLAGLREEYNNTFNQARKNKLEEQILKTEGAINKLIAASDKLGFKLADLDAGFKMLGVAPMLAGAETAALTNKTKAFATNAGKAGNSTKGFSNALKQLGFGAKTTGNNFRGAYNGVGMFFSSLFKWGIVFPLIIRGIGAMSKSLFDSLMTNQQFANSLHQIQTNLMVAFTPIFYAVLPAINALMSALATITTYIAMFTSMLFGKTYQASYQATQGLINAKEAMGAYGNSAKKAGKDAKGALAGFDEINVLANNKHDSDGGGGGGGKSKVPKLAAPSINTAPTSAAGKAVEKMINDLKAVMATLFNPLKSAWQKDGASVMSAFYRAIDGTKNTLKHLYSVLQTPPVQLFIENIARIGLALAKLALSIYNNFILPMVNWFISVMPGLSKGLNPLLEGIRKFIDFLSSSPNLLTVVCSTVLGLIAAFKILEVSLVVVKSIEKLNAILFILAENPIILVIAAIAALVVAFTALYASNEKFRNKVNEVASAISSFFMPVINTLKGVLLDVWNKALIPLGNCLIDIWKTVIEPLSVVIKDVLGMAIKFIIDIATMLWKNVLYPFIDFLSSIFIQGIQAAIEIYKAWKPVIQAIINIMLFLWKNVLAPVVGFMLGTFKGAFEGVFRSIKDIIGGLKVFFTGIIDFITGVFTGNWSRAWKGVVEIFKGIVSVLGGIFKTPLNAVIGLINGAVDSINNIKVPKIDLPFGMGTVGGWNLGIKHIPYLAKGGVIDSPTLAMVGEAGKEAVVPLENNTGWMDKVGSVVASAVLAAMQFNTQSSNNPNNNSGDTILQLDGTTFARLIKPYVDSENQRIGNMIIKPV